MWECCWESRRLVVSPYYYERRLGRPRSADPSKTAEGWGTHLLELCKVGGQPPGVLDPTKVVRTALQNAGSIALLMLTTEALVSEIPEEKKGSPMSGGMDGMY